MDGLESGFRLYLHFLAFGLVTMDLGYAAFLGGFDPVNNGFWHHPHGFWFENNGVGLCLSFWVWGWQKWVSTLFQVMAWELLCCVQQE